MNGMCVYVYMTEGDYGREKERWEQQMPTAWMIHVWHFGAKRDWQNIEAHACVNEYNSCG